MPAKKNVVTVSDMISDLRGSIASTASQDGIPDIITFTEDKRYLGLPYQKSPAQLRLAQKITLKIFYRGSIGNDNIELTEEEIEFCEKHGLNTPERGDMLGKYKSDANFLELVLVWGRRAGKDWLSSIIALYEAMKLLECPGGDPYAYYNIASSNPITILTIANSQGQAHIAFSEMRDKLLGSKYFQDKYIKDGLAAETINLLTPKDKEENSNFAERDLGLKTKGSILIEVGHSNTSGLLGKGCFVLILDEVASYKNTGGVSSGDRIYSALTPTISTYMRQETVLDEKGKPVLDNDGNELKDVFFDGKIISISSPLGKEGKLWDLFSEADLHPERLACRLATWEVIPERTREILKKTYSSMSEEEFDMHFGAEFSGTAGQSFFSEDYVKACFNHNVSTSQIGQPGCVYFVHLDPSSTSHNYALAIAHKEIFVDPTTKKSDFVVVLDMIKHWHPTPSKPVIASEVDQFVINLKRYFHIGMVTYDAWNSSESKLRLRKAGIPNKETRFTNRFKMIIYDELEQLINGSKLIVPDDGPTSILLKEELIALQRKIIPTGYRIGPRRDGDGCKTDDVCDAVAGACYAVMNQRATALPQGRLARMGVAPQNNQITWQSMQGPIGFGTGKQVAEALEARKPPRTFRFP